MRGVNVSSVSPRILGHRILKAKGGELAASFFQVDACVHPIGPMYLMTYRHVIIRLEEHRYW